MSSGKQTSFHEIVTDDVGHIGIVVTDIESALNAHATAGPFSVFRYDRGLVPRLSVRGQEDPGSWWLAINQSRPQIEVIAPIACLLYEEWLRQHGPGVHHLGYFVDSVDETARRLHEAGFQTLMTGSGHGVDGDGAFTYYDTSATLGYVVETIEPPARRKPPVGIVEASGVSSELTRVFGETYLT